MKKLILILFSLGIVYTVSAQEYIQGDASSRVDSIIRTMPSTSFTNEYRPLDDKQQSDWAKVVGRILEGNLRAASAKAEKFGYRVITFLDLPSQKTYYFLEKHPDSLNYWGTLVFNPDPVRRRLVIQVPHPLADQMTGSQGFEMFKETGALLFCISGTHRCNSSELTSCSGTTTACTSEYTNFRKSDQAHSVESMFQVTTDVLLQNDPQMIFIQPHGFSQDPGEPDYVMSNGTRYTPETDYLTALRDTLLTEDPFLKFAIIHIDGGWPSLAALTNTQGRLVNRSSSPCSLNATYATGRFLHIEQALAMRSPDEWYLLNNALMKVFPEDAYRSVIASFTAELDQRNVLLQWETSEERGNSGFEIQSLSDNGDWNFVAFVSANKTPGTYKYYDPYSGRGNLYYRLKQINIDGTARYIPAVAVDVIIASKPVLYDNYPNPFNSSTIISFELPQREETELAVYNVIGEKVRTLNNGILDQGIYKISFNADDLPAGVYFYRLSTNSYAETKKLVVLK